MATGFMIWHVSIVVAAEGLGVCLPQKLCFAGQNAFSCFIFSCSMQNAGGQLRSQHHLWVPCQTLQNTSFKPVTASQLGKPSGTRRPTTLGWGREKCELLLHNRRKRDHELYLQQSPNPSLRPASHCLLRRKIPKKLFQLFLPVIEAACNENSKRGGAQALTFHLSWAQRATAHFQLKLYSPFIYELHSVVTVGIQITSRHVLASQKDSE